MVPGLPEKLIFQMRLLRRAARRWKQALRHGSRLMGEAPVLFANSFPKSGTHLLTQVMEGFCHLGPAVVSGLPAVVTFLGDSGRQRAEGEILSDLHWLLPGDIAYGHLYARPRLAEFLCQDGFASYFILRDPRDVVVSHVHYVTEMESKHVLHRYYRETLHSFDERLTASIQGVESHALIASIGEAAAQDLALPNIRERFAPYLGWLERSEVLTLQYEGLINQREQTLGQVFDHALQRGFPTKIERHAAIRILENSINPPRSPTFRSGKTGAWRAVFGEPHKQLFKQIAGDLLIRLDYEASHDW